MVTDPTGDTPAAPSGGREEQLRRMFPNSPGMFPASTKPLHSAAAPGSDAPQDGPEARLRKIFPASYEQMKPQPIAVSEAVRAREAQLRKTFPNSPQMFSAEPPTEGAEADRPATDEDDAAPRTPPATPRPVEIEVPHGANVDPAFVEDLRTVAGELRLDEKKAGKVLELHSRVRTAEDKAWEDQVSKWESAIRADPEIGGHALVAVVSNVRGLLREFGTPGLVQALNESGLASHPEVIRVLTRVASALHVARKERTKGADR